MMQIETMTLLLKGLTQTKPDSLNDELKLALDFARDARDANVWTWLLQKAGENGTPPANS